MHIAVCEFARNVAGMEGANSTEFDPETPFPVIDLLPEQKEIADMGGTMRLGADPVKLHDHTTLRRALRRASIYERHRHRYEVNNHLRRRLESDRPDLFGHLARRAVDRGNRVLKRPPVLRCLAVPSRVQVQAERPAPLFREFVGAALTTRRARSTTTKTRPQSPKLPGVARVRRSSERSASGSTRPSRVCARSSPVRPRAPLRGLGNGRARADRAGGR